MNITMLVLTDGRRECIRRTVTSAAEMLSGPITHRIMVNDSLDPAYASFLDETFPEFTKLHPQKGSWARGRRKSKRGFCGAIQAGWAALPSDTDFVFHLEDDFVFNRPVDLTEMARVLGDRPYLRQIALRRQAWSDEEKAAGGVVELYSQETPFVDTEWEGLHWIEHRAFFTTNPALYSIDVTRGGWPDPPVCESVFTSRMKADPEVRFGYWGAVADEPWVEHIGETRAGSGY